MYDFRTNLKYVTEKGTEVAQRPGYDPVQPGSSEDSGPFDGSARIDVKIKIEAVVQGAAFEAARLVWFTHDEDRASSSGSTDC
jgi:hypothetical protein